MYGSDIERLKRDSNEIRNHVKRVEKNGNMTLSYKLRRKYEYLNSYIEELSKTNFSQN
jgi:hypothetical protein